MEGRLCAVERPAVGTAWIADAHSSPTNAYLLCFLPVLQRNIQQNQTILYKGLFYHRTESQRSILAMCEAN